MARDSLLRQIFRRGLFSTKSRKAAHPVVDDEAASSVKSIDIAVATEVQYTSKAQDAVDAETSVKIEEQQGTKRSTNSCSSSCSSYSSDAETVLVPIQHMPATPQVPSAPVFSRSDIFHAVIEEANAATASHMDTLNTTLALLDALQGFSATVDLLRREMEDKKRDCEEMRRELLSFEEVVKDAGCMK